MLAPATPSSDPTLAFSGIATIPVRVWQEEGKWRKQPLAEWDQATINEDQLERWWRRWPDALPGVPLAAVGWCAIDVDDPSDPAWIETFTPMRMLGPHSKVRTPSGGMHYVFAQPPEPIAKMQWSAGVEILGTSCLLTIHDVEAILFPRVAPRAILPKVFWKSYQRVEVYPTNKERPSAHRPPTVAGVADVDAALLKLDACEWRGRHDEWLALMIAAKSQGGSENGWVRWSMSDPHYAGDERIIRRKWRSIEPGHGGALFKLLAEHGIRLRPQSKAEPFLIGGAHLSAKVPAKAGDRPKPPANLHSRSGGLLRWLSKNQSGDGLFSAACLLAELGLTQATTTRLISGNLPLLRRDLGDVEFTYQITRAYAWVAAKGAQPAPTPIIGKST